MKTRSLPPFLGLVVVALLASLLAPTSSATAAAGAPSYASADVSAKKVKPSEDFPSMPRRCATRKEKIPASPVVCGLNKFSNKRPSILLWGDSHSWMFIPALKAAVEGRNVNLIAVMMGSCPPMDNNVGPDDPAPACFHSNALGIDTARKLEANGQPYKVVLAGSWQRYVHARKVKDTESYVGQMAIAMKNGTPRLARTLKSIGADVDVIGQVATVPEKHRKCAQGNLPYACQLPRAKALPEWSATRQYVGDVLKSVLGGRRTIDVNPFFCNDKVCKGKVGSTRTWFDDLHLSASMSTKLASYFEPTVDAVDPPTTPQEPQDPDEPEEPGCIIPILC